MWLFCGYSNKVLNGKWSWYNLAVRMKCLMWNHVATGSIWCEIMLPQETLMWNHVAIGSIWCEIMMLQEALSRKLCYYTFCNIWVFVCVWLFIKKTNLTSTLSILEKEDVDLTLSNLYFWYAFSIFSASLVFNILKLAFFCSQMTPELLQKIRHYDSEKLRWLWETAAHKTTHNTSVRCMSGRFHSSWWNTGTAATSLWL